MLEIEMKFVVRDFATVEECLVGWQARADEPITESDHYYNAPDRDFARTDEAFRLRRVGLANRLTYKGPKQPGVAKTRLEIEVPLAEGERPAEDLLRMVQQLGYRASAVVTKRRRVYHMRRDDFPLEICLDEVEGLGKFVEVEILAEDRERGRAERVLTEVAAALGLNDMEKRSYLEMILSAQSPGGDAE